MRASAPRIIPILSTGVMFAILISLGVWQVHRLHWKQGILAAIDHAEAAPPIPLPASPTQFQKVQVSGTLDPTHRLLYGADVRDTPQGPVLGAQLLEPLLRGALAPIVADLGWIPENSRIAPAGPASLTGYIRAPDQPRLFTPADDPATHRFYTLNPARIGAALGLSVAPYTLIILGAPSPGGPIPATELPRPPNDHLSYAITWFSLAAVLAAIFAIWIARQSRAGE